MKWQKRVIWGSLLVFAILFASLTLGKEELLEVRVTKCVRPNIVVAEVKGKGGIEKVRIKLAGLRIPFENPEIYRQALSCLRGLVEGKTASFDFALGFSPEQRPWVGYLYVEGEKEDEPCIVNAILIREGLATLDAATAGRNLLGYLMSMQEKAQEEGLGVWKKVPKKEKQHEEECPSCVIRSF